MTKHRFSARLAVTFGAFLWVASTSLSAETWYRWVDRDGMLHYTRDTPMGAAYVEITMPDPVRWYVPPELPSELTEDSPVSAKGLFRSVAPSVYWLESKLATGEVAYGSAVAISDSEALTNCHIVSGSENLTIGGDAQQGSAPVVVAAANYATDRCVVRSRDMRLVPVPGLRHFDSLSVGEPVYAIGNPRRLERTLSEGLISGKREFNREQRYLQTSAAISPGSSGGGLFDARGNLIGITTSTLRGSQNINFAIPAEDFWP
jgi:S1-C subfamily serine protease